jgi:hypothetical protein
MGGGFDYSKNELISEENIIKHLLLSDLMRFIPIYFLRDANVSAIVFNFAPTGQKFR